MKTTTYEGVEIVRVAKGQYEAVIDGQVITGARRKEVELGILMVLSAKVSALAILRRD